MRLWMIAASVMLATFMVVLDSSVANVALPHIAGNLSRRHRRIHLGADQLPGLQRHHAARHRLAHPARFGRKRLLMASIVVFTVASLLCGVAAAMPMLICARVLQGLGGGGMLPIAQAILLETFPAASTAPPWRPTAWAWWWPR